MAKPPCNVGFLGKLGGLFPELGLHLPNVWPLQCLPTQLVRLVGLDGVRDEDTRAEHSDQCRCDLDHCTRPQRWSLLLLIRFLAASRFQDDFVNR